MIVLTDRDDGRRIELAMNAVLTVQLPENPTTGYRWTVETADGLRFLGSRFETGGAVGAAGLRCFEFRAVRIGSSRLRLANRREWEASAAPLGSFEATVTVK